MGFFFLKKIEVSLIHLRQMRGEEEKPVNSAPPLVPLSFAPILKSSSARQVSAFHWV